MFMKTCAATRRRWTLTTGRMKPADAATPTLNPVSTASRRWLNKIKRAKFRSDRRQTGKYLTGKWQTGKYLTGKWQTGKYRRGMFYFPVCHFPVRRLTCFFTFVFSYSSCKLPPDQKVIPRLHDLQFIFEEK